MFNKYIGGRNFYDVQTYTLNSSMKFSYVRRWPIFGNKIKDVLKGFRHKNEKFNKHSREFNGT